MGDSWKKKTIVFDYIPFGKNAQQVAQLKQGLADRTAKTAVLAAI